jgi:hypothetical protein
MYACVFLGQRLRRLLPSLIETIEPDYGLLNELTKLNVLTDHEKAAVRGGNTAYDRNEQLLHYVIDKPEVEVQRFLRALELTRQKHVVNWIERNGREFSSAYFQFNYIIVAESEYSFRYIRAEMYIRPTNVWHIKRKTQCILIRIAIGIEPLLNY